MSILLSIFRVNCDHPNLIMPLVVIMSPEVKHAKESPTHVVKHFLYVVRESIILYPVGLNNVPKDEICSGKFLDILNEKFIPSFELEKVVKFFNFGREKFPGFFDLIHLVPVDDCEYEIVAHACLLQNFCSVVSDQILSVFEKIKTFEA